MHFSLEIGKKDDSDLVYLRGHMTEEACLHLLRLFELTGKICTFNFKDVSRINSCGVRNWIDFVRAFAEGRRIVFEHCSPVIVDQIAMLGSFTGCAEIRSVYGVFHCEACDQEKVKLIELKSPISGAEGRQVSVPSVRCDGCGCPMGLEDEEEVKACCA